MDINTGPTQLNGFGGYGNEVGPSNTLDYYKQVEAEWLARFQVVNINPTIEAHEVKPKLDKMLAKLKKEES